MGDPWAEIREGYRGPIWWRERYDWSVPGKIRWAAVDSGFGTPGSYVVVEIGPAEDGGSRVHIIWDRHGKTVFGKFFVGMLALTRGFFIRRHSSWVSPGSRPRSPGRSEEFRER